MTQAPILGLYCSHEMFYGDIKLQPPPGKWPLDTHRATLYISSVEKGSCASAHDREQSLTQDSIGTMIPQPVSLFQTHYHGMLVL